MGRLFVTVLNMSYTASIVILAVFLIRLLLKRAPRVFSYVLWLVVLLRLLCPLSVNVSWGLIPNENLVEVGAGTNLWVWENSGAQIEGIRGIYDVYEQYAPESGEDRNTVYLNGKDYSLPKIRNMLLSIGRIWMSLFGVWCVGVILLALYGTVSYGFFTKRLKKCRKEEHDLEGESVTDRKFTVVVSEEIKSPFVAGFIKPVIYLPAGLDQEQQRLVLEHERMHIMRGDHLIKPVAYLAVCLHWFNPLVWVAFHLMEQDMEVSCDEAVLKRVGYEKKKEYARTLLALSQQRSWKTGSPIAFGENSVKTRIKMVVKQKEARVWMVTAASIGVLAAAVLLLVNGNWNRQPASVEEAVAESVEQSIDNGQRGIDTNEEITYLPEERIAVSETASSDSVVTEHQYYPNDDSTEAEYTYEEGGMSKSVKNGVMELVEKYEKFGLTAEIYENDYQLYYNGEPVCFFADNQNGQNADTFTGTVFTKPASKENGYTGVMTEYDENGNVIGLIQLSKEEVNAIFGED